MEAGERVHLHISVSTRIPGLPMAPMADATLCCIGCFTSEWRQFFTAPHELRSPAGNSTHLYLFRIRDAATKLLQPLIIDA